MEITNELINVIDKIYVKYYYLNISKEDLTRILQEELNKIIDKYSDKDTFITYIKHRLEARIISLGMELFTCEDKVLIIINNYIKYIFDNVATYEEALKDLRKISKLFSKYSYIPEPNMIINLINTNDIFRNMLELVTLNHLTYIKDGKLNKLFNDHNIILMIDVYCMTRGIEIQYNDVDYDGEKTKHNNMEMYYEEINNIPSLSFEETKELSIRIKNGDNEAKKRFIEGNLKLVVMLARNYYNSNGRTLLLDLIQAGNIGLMRAVNKYDINLGYRFSTYASCWINTEVVREIQNNGRTIRIPIPTHEKINAYRRMKQTLEQKKGMEVSSDEVAEVMKISKTKASEYEKLQEEPLSLNYLVGEEETTEVIDLISDDSFMERIELRNLSSELRKLLNDCGLTYKEIQILSLRYGLVDGVTRTLEEVGNIFNVRKETIRRNESKALYKIRMYAGTKEFACYMDNPSRAIKILERFKQVYNEDSNNRYKSNPLEDDDYRYNTVK